MEEKIDKAISVAKGIIPSRTKDDDIQKVAQSVLNLSHVKAIYVGCEPTDEMDEELSFVLGRVRTSLGATELQQITQAALHLMTARSILTTGKPKPKRQGAGA